MTKRSSLGLLPAVFGLAMLLAAAAEAEAPQTAPAEPLAAVEAIAPADLAFRADIDERFLRDARLRAGQPDPTGRIEDRLAANAAAIGRLEERLRNTDLRTLPVARLESIERQWNFYGRQMQAWSDDLRALTQPFSDDAAGLARRRAAWTATRDGTGRALLAPALLQRIDSMLAAIDGVDRTVSAPLGQLMDLGRRGGDVQSRIESGQKVVAAAIDYQDRRLTMIDAPPLWVALHGRAMVGVAGSDTIAGLEIEQAFIQEFSAANAQRLKLQLSVGLLLLPLLLWLGRRSRRLVSDDPELQGAARLLTRPVSSWLALCMLGSMMLEPDAPVSLQRLALVVALVPVLRLLPRQVFALLGPGPYVAVALFVLNALGFLFTDNPLWFRFHLLGTSLLALLAVLWLQLRTPQGGAAAADTLTRAAVRGLGWLAVAALLVAVLANVFGNVSLAVMLTTGTLNSAFLGLMLYAGAAVLGAMLKLLLSWRQLLRLSGVARHAGRLLQGAGRLIRLSALVLWIFFTLSELRIYRPVAGWLRGVLTYRIEAGELAITPGNFLLFLFAAFVAFWIARVVRILLAEDLLPRMSLPRGVGNSISTLSYYSLVFLGLLVSLAVVGFKASELALVFGALGVGIGFGLQNVVNNFVSGLILMFERPVQPGDVVEITGTAGTVRSIGMRATTISTFEGADVVVPNGTLLSEKLINWTLTNRTRRLDVAVGVAYGTDPGRMMDLLLDTARGTPGVASYPAPVALFTGFGASSLDFAVRAWTNEFDDWVRIRSDLTVRVHAALAAAGIAIPFPQQDLHLRTVSPEAAAQLAGTPPAAADSHAAPRQGGAPVPPGDDPG